MLDWFEIPAGSSFSPAIYRYRKREQGEYESKASRTYREPSKSGDAEEKSKKKEEGALEGKGRNAVQSGQKPEQKSTALVEDLRCTEQHKCTNNLH